jgi:hypothetical protein
MIETRIPRVSDIHYTPASVEKQRRGLLGWVSFRLGDVLRLDSVAVRKTLDDRLVLSFPSRRDIYGYEHSLVRPVDDRVRRAIEREVLRQLGFNEGRR